MTKASEHDNHADGKRFHVRTYNGGVFQVYGCGLLHICDCVTDAHAHMIANALEQQAQREDADKRLRAAGIIREKPQAESEAGP